MIGKKKKPEPISRSPHINRQKQSSFQYSSNRSQSERIAREHPEDDEKFTLPRLQLAAFKLVHGLVVIGFFAIIIILSLLFTKPHSKLEGTKSVRSENVYNDALADIVGGGFMGHSKLTINRTEIETRIEDKFPELLNVNVTTPLFSPSIVVSATISQPTIVLVANSKNYLVDSRGIALVTTDKSHKLLQVEDQTGAIITVGKPALTTPQMSFIAEIKRQSESKGLAVEQMFLVAGGGELDVRYTDQAYFVKYNLYEDARKSFGTFFATKEHVEMFKPVPSEYIDVRVPERAYTK